MGRSHSLLAREPQRGERERVTAGLQRGQKPGLASRFLFPSRLNVLLEKNSKAAFQSHYVKIDFSKFARGEVGWVGKELQIVLLRSLNARSFAM